MGYWNYDRLLDPLVRDLAWVAWSPPLLQAGALPVRDPLAGSIWRADPERLWRRLLELDSDPAARAALLTPTADFRLGTYFERLWHVLLDLAPDVQVLARNIRLQDGGTTLGELDLLLETSDGEVLHLELAIKFYLGQPAAEQASPRLHSPASSWLGPDPRDSLDSKLRRMLEHQLPLAQRMDLAAAGLPRPDRSCAWLQGQLFFPMGEELAPPPDFPATGYRHHWCSFSQWAKQGAEATSGWLALPHKRWLMPPVEQPFGNAAAAPDWTPRRAQMLVRMDGDGDPLQAQRVMLVADDWPLS